MVRNILGKLRSIKNGFARLTPSRPVLGKLIPVFGMLAIGVLGYFFGRLGRPAAQTREYLDPLAQTASSSDYKNRVVAYIYDNIPISREDLGEFLITRLGAERLAFMVDRRLVELACKARGIEVSDQLVEDQLDRDLKAYSANMTRKDFAQRILKPVKKTMYEWKEDVVRPKLMLAQLVEPEIQVTEEDVQKGFEGRYGPKVQCRLIVLPDTPQKYQIWEKLKDNEGEFERVARTLNRPELCAEGGKVPPITKHFGDARIEQIAFNLKKGEVSPLIGMPDETVIILKCDQHIPADLTKRLENERVALAREIHEQKLAQRIYDKLAELRKEAHPNLLLRNENHQADPERTVAPEITGNAAPAQRPAVPKVGG